MTEFEQQVATALNWFTDQEGVIWFSDKDAQTVQRVVGALAPRVAAAIEAAAAQTTVNIGVALGPGVIADALKASPPVKQWYEAALAALRRDIRTDLNRRGVESHG